jgi:hypothetical protein
MYQIEVKLQLVRQLFPPASGWEVTVHLDGMERGLGRQNPQRKRDIAHGAEKWLVAQGIRIGNHPEYGRADLVATHPTRGTSVLEVEGFSARQKDSAVYSALGQAIVMMTRFVNDVTFGIAVPDNPDFERQLRKLPAEVCRRLHLKLFLVSTGHIRTLHPDATIEEMLTE